MGLKNNLIKFITISSIYTTSMTGLLGSDAGSSSEPDPQDVDMIDAEEMDEVSAMEQLLASLQDLVYMSEGEFDRRVLEDFTDALNRQSYDHCKDIIRHQIPDVSVETFSKIYTLLSNSGEGDLLGDMNPYLSPGKYLAIDRDHAEIWGRERLILNFARAHHISNPEALLKLFEVISETLKSRQQTIVTLRKALNSNSPFETDQVSLILALDHHQFLSDKVLALLIHHLKVGDIADNLNKKISVIKGLKQDELLTKTLEQALIDQDPKLAQVIEFAHSGDQHQGSSGDGELSPDNLALVLSSGSGQFVLPFRLLTNGGLQKFEDDILAALESPELFEAKLLESVKNSDVMSFGILMSKGQDKLNVNLILKVFNTAGNCKNQYVANAFATIIQEYEYLPEVSNATKSYLLSMNEAHRAAARVADFYWQQCSGDEKIKPQNDLARMTQVATQVLKNFLEDESKFPYTKKGLNVLVSFLTKEKGECNGEQWARLSKLKESFSFETLMAACVFWNKNLKFPPDIRTSVR